MDRTIRDLRSIGMVEGWSFIILLFIAMPLKYLVDLPFAVRIVGMVHGILVIVYVCAAVRAWKARGWNLFRLGQVLAASMLPFGPFLIDRSLGREDSISGAAT